MSEPKKRRDNDLRWLDWTVYVPRKLRGVCLTIESALSFGLIFGCLGWAAFISPVLKPIVPAWIAAIIATVPWLIWLMVTFTNKPFLPPRVRRLSLVFAMCWFAGLAISAEVLCFLGKMPPDSPEYAGTIGRALMHVGWIAFIPLVRYCITARRWERIWDRRRSRRAANSPVTNPENPT